MTGEHAWCRCTETPCGVGLLGHEGHCCLRGDCTDDNTGALGWLTAHQDHCPTDHSQRISALVEQARKEAPCAQTN